MKCYACQADLVPDDGAPDDPATYQFDNALWLGFHGGYAMFVDNLEARLPTNTEDRWLRDEDGEYLMGTKCICSVRDRVGAPQAANVGWKYHEFECPCRNPIDNLDWEPEYREERVLPGQPDYEAVICHECAHELCATVPWVERLIRPHGSHAHKTAWKEAHPEHWGWDYDRHNVQ